MKIVVSQKGAREHFLVARALHQRGKLAGLVVDWYAPRNLFLRFCLARLLGARGRSALAVRSDEIPDRIVYPLRALGLWSRWKLWNTRAPEQVFRCMLSSDIAFAKAVARVPLPSHDILFSYSYAALEALEAERKRGVLTILSQIDPGPTHYAALAREEQAWPEYCEGRLDIPGEYLERNKREWKKADVVVVNSPWARDSLIEAGCEPEKLEVLPLAYESSETQPLSRASQSQVLRVLWVGNVNINKGIQYLVEAARRLIAKPVEFTVVGRIQIPRAAVEGAPRNIRWVGPVPRGEVHRYYAAADIFVLPTISDGFALTQLEAMAHGLPVITTPNCGQVVKEGETGFIIPARDPAKLEEAIMKFILNSELAAEMSPACRGAVKAFSMEAYSCRLLGIIERHLARLGAQASS